MSVEGNYAWQVLDIPSDLRIHTGVLIDVDGDRDLDIVYGASSRNGKYKNTIFFEGYFESEKYFYDVRNELLNEFSLINKEKYIDNKYHNKFFNKNIVSICIRQNRFSERGKNYLDSSSIEKKVLLICSISHEPDRLKVLKRRSKKTCIKVSLAYK